MKLFLIFSSVIVVGELKYVLVEIHDNFEREVFVSKNKDGMHINYNLTLKAKSII